ncbi:MAG: anti-sigma F factor [Eubacteriales bacterium]
MKHTPINKLSLTLPAISINESVSRAVVGAFVACLNPTINDIADLKCVVSEAVTNCIVHAYPQQDTPRKPGEIYITVVLYDDRRVKIIVRDYGCGIPDIAKAKTPLFTTDPGGERSGMGFSVMENFTDKLTVQSWVGRGTKITMFKQLH